MKFLKTALVTDVLIVLPAWLAILLLLQVLLKLGVLVRPVADQLPTGVNHPTLVALVTFLAICLLVGLLVHTAIGRAVGKRLEIGVFRRVPGYSALRSIAAKAGDLDSEHDFSPALIEVEDGCLAPAFVVETHAAGVSTVFMPSVPTPMAGALFIMPTERIHLVDVSVTTMMKCISRWGTDSGEIVAKLDPSTFPVARP